MTARGKCSARDLLQALRRCAGEDLLTSCEAVTKLHKILRPLHPSLIRSVRGDQSCWTRRTVASERRSSELSPCDDVAKVQMMLAVWVAQGKLKERR
eukprot:scaffold3290_cov259-Pinguiococcus_pyrenoidosus.AAC.11